MSIAHDYAFNMLKMQSMAKLPKSELFHDNLMAFSFQNCALISMRANFFSSADNCPNSMDPGQDQPYIGSDMDPNSKNRTL